MMEHKIKLIYVLGNSRSGSTILSIFTGLHPSIHYLGELKVLDRSFHKRTCSCGEKSDNCDFWSAFKRENPGVFERPVISNNGFYRLWTTCKSIYFPLQIDEVEEEKKIILNLWKSVVNRDPESQYLLDSSKSLKRFILLSQIKELEVIPIFIERDQKSNLASFVKRGKGLIRSHLRLKVNQRIISKYLEKNNVDHFKVNYEEFASQPEKIRSQILDFIGMRDHVGFEEKDLDSMHLITGSSNSIRGFKKDQSIELKTEVNDPFSKFQHLMLKCLRL